MTHKTTMKAQQPSDQAQEDFATLADRWIDGHWHLPPGGDQSWRQEEAQRMFDGIGKDGVNDKGDLAPVGPDNPPADEKDGSNEPGFRRVRALNVVLPLSLATCVALVVVAFSVPEILTSRYWSPAEPKASSVMPISVNSTAAAEGNVAVRDQLRPSPAYGGGSDHVTDKIASQTHPKVAQAVAPAKDEQPMVVPSRRPAVALTARYDQRSEKVTVRVAKAKPPRRALPPRKLAARSLPPIGAAYFSSHAPAGSSRKLVFASPRPIGEAYFAGHSPATTN
jgi:hypothetical protein